MASVLDFANKNLGWAPDPKLHFRATALNQLHSSKHPIPVTDKSYWLTYYLVFDFASKVPTLIPNSKLSKAIRDRPENVENLLRVLILKLDSLIQSQSTRKILEEREWNSLGVDDGSGPQNVSNISSSLKSQIKSFSLKVSTSIYNGAVEIANSMDQLISRIILCLSDPRSFNQEEPKESLCPTPFLLVKTNHAGLSQWDCQLEDGKYNQMDQYSVRTDQPCPDQSRESSEDHPPQLLSGSSERHTTGVIQLILLLALLNLNISIKSLNSNSQAGSEDASTKQGLGKAID
ncbi:hypothetical protein BY996DRAFT_8513115 [Phakopsora pachyrhizi]|nr:hypothetical protein BY996DRAFT_8513115 [Phakopsora pachyrhizi]